MKENSNGTLLKNELASLQAITDLQPTLNICMWYREAHRIEDVIQLLNMIHIFSLNTNNSLQNTAFHQRGSKQIKVSLFAIFVVRGAL